MKTIKKLFGLLSPKERKHAVWLLGMMLVMAVLDTIGVASIMPFMAVLANPQLIEANEIFALAYSNLGFTHPQDFLFFLGLMVFLLLVISLIFKALTTYASVRFSLMREFTIGQRLVESYLRQPYSWFLYRHSADLGKVVLSEVQAVILNGMLPLMNILSQGAVAAALFILLLIVDPVLALTTCLTLAAVYILIIKIMSAFLSHLGQERLSANEQRFTALNEAFGAFKEVKVSGVEQVYVNRFSEPAEAYAKHQATASVIQQVPRFALEGIAFGGMLLLALFLMHQSDDFSNALSIIALYAFTGYRLMPSLQLIYASISQLRFAGPAVDALHSDLTGLTQGESPKNQQGFLTFNQTITLNNVVYAYPRAQGPTLKGVSMSIPFKSSVGFVGSTGSGKSTTVDLILGLLEPQEGTLIVDGQVIDAGNRRQWQKFIGYVPQQIYLADDTIASNIAFGVPQQDIDQAAIVRAAKIANLHDFVVNDLPQGYSTKVGERGIRLSGGQRQRIGIARALYNNPQVLILDEATSALDKLTEQAVMEAVNKLSHEITIIIVAHRLSTVRNCDQIYLFEKGQIKDHAPFDTLVQISPTFRAMALQQH